MVLELGSLKLVGCVCWLQGQRGKTGVNRRDKREGIASLSNNVLW